MPSGSGFFGGYAYRAETATDMVAHQSHIMDFASAFHDEPYIFANIASFGSSGEIVRKANAGSKALGGKATFFLSTVKTLVTYDRSGPPRVYPVFRLLIIPCWRRVRCATQGSKSQWP